MSKKVRFCGLLALACSAAFAQSSKLSPDLAALNPRSTAKVIVQWKNAPAITTTTQKGLNLGGLVGSLLSLVVKTLTSINATVLTVPASSLSALAADDADVMSNEPDANRRKARRLAAQGPRWAERMAELELAAPTGLVRDTAAIELGDRGLELRFLGRGHTDGDLWILVSASGSGPGAGIALAGDLVEESGPPAFGTDSFPLEWAGTLDRALELLGPDTVVIPGHGESVDTAFVLSQRAAIDAVAREIRRLHAAGVPADAAVAEGTWALPAQVLHDAVARGYAALE